MDMKCKEEGRCVYRRESGGNCTILNNTVFGRPCPFRKEKDPAAGRGSAGSGK